MKKFKSGDYVIYNADELWYHEDIPALFVSQDGNKVKIQVFDQDTYGKQISTEVETDIFHIHPAMTAPLKQKGVRKKTS